MSTDQKQQDTTGFERREAVRSISDLQSRLKKLMEQQQAEIKKLDRSLDIRELWPDAFAQGSCRTRWRKESEAKGGRATLTITNGLGEQKVFEESEVPESIERPWLSNDRPARRPKLMPGSKAKMVIDSVR